jgi:hypothetical protein
MAVVTVRPGETVTVVGLPTYMPGLEPSHPIAQPPSGPVDPGYGYPEKPVDPGYGVPWRPPQTGPVDPGYGVDVGTGPVRPTHPIALPPSVPPTPEHPWVPPSGPVDPGYFPPGVVAPPNAPDGGGNWVWAWLPGVGWRWVRVPGPGEAGPK